MVIRADDDEPEPDPGPLGTDVEERGRPGSPDSKGDDNDD
jgi:hypothetical protein